MKTHAVLAKYFARKKKASAGFSMRALAKRLDVSAPFLSRVLSGKKSIPPDFLEKLGRALDVEPELLAGLLQDRVLKKGSEVSSPATDWPIADMQATQILRNWYNVPILEITTLANFDGTAATIARRLNLSLTSTEIALRELISLGLITVNEGRYEKTDRKLRITSAKSLAAIRHFHDEMLEKSQIELRVAQSDAEFQNRLITGITVSASPERVQEAKRKLADFLHELADDLSATPGTEVYHLAAQLFPLTKGNS